MLFFCSLTLFILLLLQLIILFRLPQIPCACSAIIISLWFYIFFQLSPFWFSNININLLHRVLGLRLVLKIFRKLCQTSEALQFRYIWMYSMQYAWHNFKINEISLWNAASFNFYCLYRFIFFRFLLIHNIRLVIQFQCCLWWTFYWNFQFFSSFLIKFLLEWIITNEKWPNDDMWIIPLSFK